MGVTREEVEACYREILGREPESVYVVDEYVQEGISVEKLRRRLVGSREFLLRQEEAEREKMLVYGSGDHLRDMLGWHGELGERIGRVFDKNPEKIGTLTPSGQVIEPPENLRQLAPGTRLAIAAIRYYADIVEEVRQINPGIRCLDIDDAYQLPDKSWMPCADKLHGPGMIVYGLGAHLFDMQVWHPELSHHIARIIDKDPKKIGCKLPSLGVVVEGPDTLRGMSNGTEIAVAAIRYFDEIKEELMSINPGLSCRKIDDIWAEYVNRSGSVSIVKNDTQATMTEKSIFVKCLASRLRLEVEHEKMRRAIALSWHTEIAQ